MLGGNPSGSFAPTASITNGVLAITSVMIVSMVVLGGLGHLPGVVLGALLLAALPEVLRYVASPLQAYTGGRLDASILRQLLIALAMIVIMLMRPRGLWPSPDRGKSLQATN